MVKPQDARYDGFYFGLDGPLRYKGRIYVLDSIELRKLVWKEVHSTPYLGHLGVKKFLVNVKPLYFWKGMKGDVARFVSSCFEFQRVKDEHHHPIGILNPYDIPYWKWKFISTEFSQGLPMSQNIHNVILVMVDKITKVAHFILGYLTNGAPIIAHKILQEVFRLHGVPEYIISDRDA